MAKHMNMVGCPVSGPLGPPSKSGAAYTVRTRAHFDHIHVTHVCMYVHTLARVDVTAEKATRKVKQMCWSGHTYCLLYMGITCREL